MEAGPGVIKLADGEAAKLAAFLVHVARPKTPADEATVLHWVRRLEGKRS